MSSESRTRAAVVVMTAAVLLVNACEIEKVAIPSTPPMIALHGVLSAAAPDQVVLLERTRTGDVPSYELGDPRITSALAETSAVVTLLAPDGQTYVATEDRLDPARKGRGSGFYRFTLPGTALTPGGEYRLNVVTAEGDVLEATTVVPSGTAAALPQPMTFDRVADTLVLQWPASAGAASYFVRIETPYGPRTFFTNATSVRLPGNLRNPDAPAIPHVFVPGFTQVVTVSAVDANFYDWYRTHNNRISGEGLVNRVEGGIGVFGSLVRLRFDSLDVVEPVEDAVEGHFEFSGTQLEASLTPNLSIDLYLESRSARGDQPDAVSGRYARRPYFGIMGCLTCGMLGTARGQHVELAMLAGWAANDTMDVFVGDVRGDTLVGRYRSGFSARYVRH